MFGLAGTHNGQLSLQIYLDSHLVWFSAYIVCRQVGVSLQVLPTHIDARLTLPFDIFAQFCSILHCTAYSQLHSDIFIKLFITSVTNVPPFYISLNGLNFQTLITIFKTYSTVNYSTAFPNLHPSTLYKIVQALTEIELQNSTFACKSLQPRVKYGTKSLE